MSNELVQIETGGIGIDFGSSLFTLKPVTLSVNQQGTTAEGATPGKFRIHETGDQYDRMRVVLLVKPNKRRQLYMGKKGTLHKVPENLICFASEPEKGKAWVPNDNAKLPQSPFCSTCSKNNDVRANWDAWNKSKDPEDIPACDSQYFAVFVDTLTKMPMKSYIGYTHRDSFEEGMQSLATRAHLLKSQGIYPNLYELSFEMYVSKEKKKNNTFSYVLKIDPKSFKIVSDEDKAEFGGLYLAYTNRNNEPEPEEEAVSVAKVENDINDAVSNTVDATVNENGEVVI